MTEFIFIRNKEQIKHFLLNDAGMNIYQIGDLDPFFFPRTKWFALTENENIEELMLLYKGDVATTVLAFANFDAARTAELLERFAYQLPDVFYAHFGNGIMNKLKSFRAEETFGTHLKMLLKSPGMLLQSECKNIRRLDEDDLQELLMLYKVHYPGNYFDKRMLETGKYFGYFEDSELLGVAGIHVYSPLTGVAALGNIVVANDHRGKGICRKLVSALCNDLLNTVDVIGLNVFSENTSAIKSYERCGFVVIGEYEEYLVKQLKIRN